MQEILKKMGLAEQEIKVYLATLELGQASLQEIAKKAGIPRTSIYNFIDNLQEKRLIWATSRQKRKVYSAAHPSQLIEIEKTRLSELQAAVPELLAIYNQDKQKPRVAFYEGLDGIKYVYADSLTVDQPIIEWADFQALKTVLGNFYQQYPIERAKRNISIKSLISNDIEARQAVASDIKLLRESKFLSTQELKTDVMVYGNKVALLSLKSTPPFAVLIEDASLAQTMRVIWQEIWERI